MPLSNTGDHQLGAVNLAFKQCQSYSHLFAAEPFRCCSDGGRLPLDIG